MTRAFADPDFAELQETAGNRSTDEDDRDDTEDSEEVNQDAKRKRKSSKKSSKKRAKVGRDDVAPLRKTTWDFPTSTTRGINEVDTSQTGK